jgi:Tfp pilus assembly protein PilO
MADTDYMAVLLEEIRDQNKAVLEVVGDMQQQLADVPKRAEFDELRADVRVIRAAVADLSVQVSDHEQRMTRLEAA